MLTRSKRKILFWISVLIFLLLVPVTILYALGYRVDPDFSLRKTGGLYISSTFTGSEIFVDKNLQRKTNLLQSGAFIANADKWKNSFSWRVCRHQILNLRLDFTSFV